MKQKQQLLQQQQNDNETRRYVKWIAIVAAIYAMACSNAPSTQYWEPDPSYFLAIEKKTLTVPGEGGTGYLYITTNYTKMDITVHPNHSYRLEKIRHSPDNTGQPVAPNHDHPVYYYRLAVTLPQSEITRTFDYGISVIACREPTEAEEKENTRIHGAYTAKVGRREEVEYIQLGNGDTSRLKGSDQTQEYRQRLENK